MPQNKNEAEKVDAWREAIAAVTKVDASVGGLRGEIKDLRTYGQRSRSLIWITVISVVLDMVLSVALGLVAVEAKRATSAAAQSVRTQALTCQTGNDFREKDRAVWKKLQDLTTANGSTSFLTSAQWDEMDVYFADTFGLRDCDQLSKPDVNLQDLRTTIAPTP